MKLNFSKLCLLFWVFTLFASCNSNGTNVSHEEHKSEMEEAAIRFFELLKNKRYDETYALFSPKFLQVTNESQLDTIYKITNEKLGNIKDFEVDEWATIAIRNEYPSSGFFLIYTVNRTICPTQETLRLEKEGEKIVIAYYDIHYDDTIVQ